MLLVTQSGEGILSIQKGPWKLVLCSGGGGKWNKPGGLPLLNTQNGKQVWQNVQLYNITADMSEQKNLASTHTEKVTELMKLLRQYILRGRTTNGKPLNKDELKLCHKWHG